MKKRRKQKTLRPTTGKVREALFNILRGNVRDARFLDLYAGTGAVGIKALDEGAAEVVFVEEVREAAAALKALIERHRSGDRARVITKKVLSFLEWAELNQLSFDILFLDPPYHSDEIISAMTAIGTSSLVRDGGLVIAEHFAKRDLPHAFGTLEKKRDYRYGDSVLTLYEARSFSHAHRVDNVYNE